VYHKYRVIERTVPCVPPTITYIVQTDRPPMGGWQQQNIMGVGYVFEPTWYTLSTHGSLQAAENAKKLVEYGLQPGDKIVG